jgi:uncharacterized protein
MSAMLRRLAGAALLCACVAGVSNAHAQLTTDKFSFPVANAEKGAMVSGELRLPDAKTGRLPAVVILHSSPGFDGRGAFYAEALNQAGIATVEIDYMQGKGLPRSPRDNLPHAYQTLQYLAGHPRIDPMRIGIMGFSWGGIIAVLTSSDELTREHTVGKVRFAAHLGLYPICWRHAEMLAGKSKFFQPSVYRRVTGRPVHILVGDKDDSDLDGCPKFMAALPAEVKPHVSLTVFPGATFAWDSRFSSRTHQAGAFQGKGGFINTVADPEISKRSRDFTVSFFSKNL